MERGKRRFTEFADEKKYVYSFGEVTCQSGIKNKSAKEYESFSISNEHGFIPQVEQFDGGNLENADKSLYIIVSPKSFAYNPARINVGSIGYQNLDRDVIVSSLYEVFKTNEKCEDIYLWYLLQTKFFFNMIQKYAEGGVRQYLFYSNFCKIKFPFPPIEEQQKIACFFSKVDERIKIQQSIVEDWQSQKKAIMQKLFSQKVRFKDDDGSDYPEWEGANLEDVVVFLDGQRKPLESGTREAGVYPYYGASGIIDYINDYIFDEELILLSEDGANIIDRNYRVCFLAKGKYWVNNHAHVLRANKDCINGFICEYLESLNYVKYNTGSAQPKLNQDVCRRLPIKKPVVEEQFKIANFLAKLDEKILVEQQILEDWQQIKKGLLQQMFV